MPVRSSAVRAHELPVTILTLLYSCRGFTVIRPSKKNVGAPGRVRA